MVIFLGVTLTFIIPRLSPVDPVEAQINRIMMSGSQVNPDAIISMREALTEMYGLEGSSLQQYFAFWGRLFRADLGPSLALFPTPVSMLLARSMWWTFGLLMTSIMISWTIGNILGAMASYYDKNGAIRDYRCAEPGRATDPLLHYGVGPARGVCLLYTDLPV